MSELLRVDWGDRGEAGVSSAATLEFDRVDIRLGDKMVLEQFSLTLSPGEIVCLLGESGSGKSTALRVAAGILSIDGGALRINEQVMSAPGLTVPPDRRGIGLMFQDFALFPHLTVLQNVLFGLRQFGREAALEQARSALCRVGLADRGADYPHMLSGGQQQRLALARSVAPRPGILLLDEPFSSLDARLRATVREETLAVLRETRVTGLIVTHDPEEAMMLGDRVALLRHGRIAQIGSATDIYNHPVDLYAARFFSPLGEIKTVAVAGQAETPFGSVFVPGLSDGTRVTVAIRTVGGLSMSATGNGTPGRIVSKRAALGTDICAVQITGVDQPLGLRQPSNTQLCVGQDVVVTLNREHVLVFAQD